MAIVLSRVGFEWPNGQTVFADLNVSLHQHVHALVGVNGVGKTTLARLIAGELAPTAGTIHGVDQVGYFPQSEERFAGSATDYLQSEPVGAPRSWISGLERARVCADLSGGEWTRLRLARLTTLACDFIVLDEPTNHLDGEGRQAVRRFLEHFRGGVLLISHDRELLRHARCVLELSNKGLTRFDVGWTEYCALRGAERERLRQDLAQAKKRRDTSSRERLRKLERQQKRNRSGADRAPDSGLSRLLIGMRKRAAQVSTGKVNKDTQADVHAAVREAWSAYQDQKIDPVMYTRLPQIEVPGGGILLEARNFNFRFRGGTRDLWSSDLNFVFRAPARVAIQGPNGAGKSTLLKLLLKAGETPGTSRGFLRLGAARARYLSQEHTGLDRNLSILENILSDGSLSREEARSKLAMFLFPAERVNQPVALLSGGERLRAGLAKVLICNPPANLLVVDEPTNNLDLANIEFVEKLLAAYPGSLIVVSHDESFLRGLDLRDEVRLYATRD